MTIKLKDIASAPWNPRADITPESVAELAADIEKNGLIQPITIWKDADGEWLCIAGNRRLAALQEINKGSQIVLSPDHYIVFGGTEAEARALTFRENHHRLNLTPLGEAAQIAQFVADGMTIRDAALALGITETKARRRARLNDLADAWKKRDNLTVDVLEKIATYPTDVQEKVAKSIWSGALTWRDIGPRFNEVTRYLDVAKFDRTACAKCLKRTGAEADLFGIADGALGYCTDCECFKAKKSAYEDAEVAKVTRGANEVVRCDGYWDMPDDEETSEKRTKDHPCAYVYFDRDGEVKVRYGESKAAKEAREAAEDAEREARDAEEAKERECINGIVKKLKDATYNADEDGRAKVEDVISATISNADENVTAWLVGLAVNDVCGWNGPQSYAQLVRILPELATLAGLTDADRAYLLDEYPETDEDGEDEDE